MIVLVLVAPMPAEAAPGDAPPIQPLLGRCTLEVGGRRLAPLRTASPAPRTYRAGGLRLTVEGNAVRAFRSADGEAAWTAAVKEGQHLDWLAADEAFTYLQTYTTDERGAFQGYVEPGHVRRLELATGRWQTTLDAAGAPAGQKAHAVLRVLTGQRYVLVLTALVKRGAARDGPDAAAAYQLTCFRTGHARPVWSKTYPAQGQRPYSGGYLLAARRPDYADSGLQELAWIDDLLLLCPEGVQPVRCLNPDTGTTLWEVERPWEFERGFIGPSVWSHFIDRFGLEPLCREPERLAAARKDFEHRYSCAVIGGPVVVGPRRGAGPQDTRWFLAVSRGPAAAFSGYLPDCILYEFDDRGQPVSLLKLPYVVRGRQFQETAGGLVWKGQDNSLMRIARAPHGGGGLISASPGGPDRLARLAWERQLDAPEPDAWLVADPAGDPTAFSDRHAVCLPAGGYLRREGGSEYTFPLAAVDLETGQDRPLVLHVPFRGRIPPPSTNYHRTWRPDGTSGIHTLGPYVLAVTALSAGGTELSITLGMDNWSAVLTFDLSGVAGFRGWQADARDGGWIRAWLAKQGSVNARDPDGRTPLMKAATDPDPRYVRALLQAGADPRAVAADGSTALTEAAGGGPAESVQALIDAGADVNARGMKYGGTTVLMAAADSPSHRRTKLRALLNAGADPNASLEKGWTPLLTAVARDHVDAVETLLAGGAGVNHRTQDGTTALLLAATRSGQTMVEVLVAAGADVNARDGEGMTPLMRAAGRHGNTGMLQALVRAGARPALKDKQGRTALDIQRAADRGEPSAGAAVLEEAAAGSWWWAVLVGGLILIAVCAAALRPRWIAAVIGKR